MNIPRNTLIFDIETRVFGKPNPEKDELRVFGCYSYMTNKYYMLKDKDQIQIVINNHRYLVGFNIKNYDNPILEREGIDLQYKTFVDLYEVFDKRAGAMKIKEGMLGDLLMSKSLDFISRLVGIVKDDEGKKKIDYSLFKKSIWTKEELKEILAYTRRDVEVTKKLYEWVESYFLSFKDFVTENNIKRKKYLTSSVAGFTYEAICKEMGWDPEMSQSSEHVTLKGGYVSYPAGEEFKGDIYCLDFNCLVEGTNIGCLTPNGFGFKKPIEKIKEGQKVRSANGEVGVVDFIKKQKYDGEVIEIVLENNDKIVCTPQHVIPVYRNNKRIDVMASEILDTDELITSQTKRGKQNPHYRGGKVKCKCVICKKIFFQFPSLANLKGCSTKCSNILRSKNNAKSNLGKTKYDTSHLMKMSLERKGKKRDVKICKNIAEANRIKTRHNYKDNKYKYKGIAFKSIYEMKVAQALDRDNIKWEYEPKVFILDSGYTYTPDFYLSDLDKWVEVKGPVEFDWTKSYKKFKEFSKENSNSVIINKERISKLKEILYGEN